MKTALSIMLILSVILAGCSAGVTPETTTTAGEASELSVAVTFYPYFDLTRQIVGDLGEVRSVVPPTTEPHSFNPSARDLAELQDITAYVKTGVEFEAFEDTLLNAVPEGVPVIDASAGIELLAGGHDHHHHGEEADHHEHEESDHVDEHHTEEHEGETHVNDEHHEEEHADEEHVDDHSDEADHHDEEHAEGTDPHVWLSPKNAQIIVLNIVEGLVQAHPEHEAALRANAAALQTELIALDAAYTEGLAACEKEKIMVTHNAYQYLAAAYNFEVIAIAGLSPESEPTPGQLAELVEEAEEYQLEYLFFEELVDPRVAQIIAEEAGTDTLTINPVAGSNADLGYVAIMNDNLDKLQIALSCQ